MKKILLIFCLIFTMPASSETLKTNHPSFYLKNYICAKNGEATFNAVNKSSYKWMTIHFDIYDSDGDPIDSFKWLISLEAQSGEKMTRGGALRDCNLLNNNTYKANVVTLYCYDCKPLKFK